MHRMCRQSISTNVDEHKTPKQNMLGLEIMAFTFLIVSSVLFLLIVKVDDL